MDNIENIKRFAELTDIEGRKLEKRKEHITHFGAGEVEHEKGKYR